MAASRQHNDLPTAPILFQQRVIRDNIVNTSAYNNSFGAITTLIVSNGRLVVDYTHIYHSTVQVYTWEADLIT